MVYAGMSCEPTMKDTSSVNDDTSTFTNVGEMEVDHNGVPTRPKHNVMSIRPRNSSVYSSSSSASCSSSGELQYVDPEGGEPAYDEYHQTHHCNDNDEVHVGVRRATSSRGIALHEQQQEAADRFGTDDYQHQETKSSGTFSRRRNPEVEEDEERMADSRRGAAARARTNPGEVSVQEVERPDPPNFYHRDMEFEVQLLSLRNKRVLMARLNEVVPRGRLSMVCACSARCWAVLEC